MSLHERLKRLLCPSCIELESRYARRDRTLSILEHSGESLDRMIAELHELQRRTGNPLEDAMFGLREDERR